MRRIHTVLVRQSFRRPATLRRMAEAVTRAGHGAGLLAAAGESDDLALQSLVVEGVLASPEDAEVAVLEVLDERPLEPKSTRLALAVGERLGTERVALAVAKRFWDLRKVDKALVARALLECGDARVLPLLESRAYRDEPEEAAWVVLSLVHGRIDAQGDHPSLLRVRERRAETAGPPLELELECPRCGEVGTYGFHHAYVDPEAQSEWGDPAFVGDVRCKACGAPDGLKPTQLGGQVLTSHMLQHVERMQAGLRTIPAVTPAQTTVGGVKMGLAEALRRLDRRIDQSPQQIRSRLERAKMRMLLDRADLDDDLAAIRAVDPSAVEASIVEATRAVRRGRREEAVALLVEGYRRLGEDPPPRVYDSEGPEALRESLEDLLLELAIQGEALPADVDLGAARTRRDTSRTPTARTASAPAPQV